MGIDYFRTYLFCQAYCCLPSQPNSFNHLFQAAPHPLWILVWTSSVSYLAFWLSGYLVKLHFNFLEGIYRVDWIFCARLCGRNLSSLANEIFVAFISSEKFTILIHTRKLPNGLMIMIWPILKINFLEFVYLGHFDSELAQLNSSKLMSVSYLNGMAIFTTHNKQPTNDKAQLL